MPAYRFSWDAFSDRTVEGLTKSLGFSATGSAAREWIGQRYKRPTEEFVRETKDALVTYWLPEYRGAGVLVERLAEVGVGPGTKPRSQSGYVDYIRNTRNCTSLRRALLEGMLRFGDTDRAAGEGGDVSVGVPRFAMLLPKKQAADGRRPHAYQIQAWNRLTAHLAESQSTGSFRGLLVMPTGSGKSYTTMRWLLEKVVNHGGRVLWIAHRHELLEQAANEAHVLAACASVRDRLRVRIVSGLHCSAAQIDPEDDIVVASVASLARSPDVVDVMLRDPKTFLVIDEAHHAPAKSYRDLVERLLDGKTHRLLGITATPTRTAEKERPVLARLFEKRTIYEVDIKQLIEQKFLSRPIPVRVDTKTNAEAGVTERDVEHLAQFNEISEEWLDRIAHLADRNHLILEHYFERRAKYGPTLVFAINVQHAALLTEALRDKGVRAEYVASYRPDGSEVANHEIVERFRRGELDVVVNVQILTEGVDLPSVKTVMLTRPTCSEILLRQMVGRALRGPMASGTDIAYLVSFEDHWERFENYLGSLDLMPDILGATQPDVVVEGTVPSPNPLFDALPWDLIRDTARRIRALGAAESADAFEAVPHGWYVLERDVDGESVHQVISVYAHQRPCWDALIERLASLSPELMLEVDASEEHDEHFFDCDVPRPQTDAVLLLVEHFRTGGSRPEYQELDERKACDPCVIAEEILERDLGERAKSELLQQRYTPLAQAIYPSMREFRLAIEDVLFERQNPAQATHRVRAVPVFEDVELTQLTPGPHHDLSRLMDEMLLQAQTALALSVPLPRPSVVEWTRRRIKGWYGKAEWDAGTIHGEGRIRINQVLDSRDVPETALRFLLWLEYLHLFLKQDHTKEFRERQRTWPGYVEADRFLENLDERFDVQYWGRASGRTMSLPTEIAREQAAEPAATTPPLRFATPDDLLPLPSSSEISTSLPRPSTGPEAGKVMIALSVRQPWAWAIFHAGKDVENRRRRVSLKETIALHASATRPSEDAFAELERILGRSVPRDLPLGVVLGTVDVQGCTSDSTSKWASPGSQHWMLANPKPYETPIRASGAASFWHWRKP